MSINQSDDHCLTELDPKNPLKLKICFKRKASASELELKQKKTRMGEAENNKTIEELLTRLESKIDKQDVTLNMKFLQQETQLNEISNEITNLKEFTNIVTADKVIAENRMILMEKDIKEMQEQLTSSVDSSQIEQVKAQLLPAWKASLAKEVWEHEHGLLIFGHKIENGEEGVRSFMAEQLKIPNPEKFRIKDVSVLGKGEVNKPPPTLVKFSHPSERNAILPFSKNLQKGTNIEKNMPKAYQKKHKEFKREAWKLKNLDYQTQIVFEGHNLVLRYRTKESRFLFSNYDSYFPQPEEVTASPTRPAQPANGKQYTLPISLDREASVNRAVIISGIKEKLSPVEMKAKFNAFVDPSDQSKTEEVKTKGSGVMVVVCKTWDDAANFSEKYHGKKFLDSAITCTLFDERKLS